MILRLPPFRMQRRSSFRNLRLDRHEIESALISPFPKHLEIPALGEHLVPAIPFFQSPNFRGCIPLAVRQHASDLI